MARFRGLTKKTFAEKADYIEGTNAATFKLLQVTDDATFYSHLYVGGNLTNVGNVAVTGMATVTGTFVASATTDLNSCLLGNVRTSTSTMETTAYDDFILLMKCGLFMSTVTLSTEYITSGRLLIVKDISGMSGTAATQVRVVPETGGTLNGGTSAATVKSNYGALWIVSDSASYFTLSSGIF